MLLLSLSHHKEGTDAFGLPGWTQPCSLGIFIQTMSASLLPRDAPPGTTGHPHVMLTMQLASEAQLPCLLHLAPAPLGSRRKCSTDQGRTALPHWSLSQTATYVAGMPKSQAVIPDVGFHPGFLV